MVLDFYIINDRINMFTVEETNDYIEWFNRLNLKEQGLVHSRISRIISYEHLGNVRQINQYLAELKWKNGRRVYFTITLGQENRIMILLLGGNKSSQTRDIKTNLDVASSQAHDIAKFSSD